MVKLEFAKHFTSGHACRYNFFCSALSCRGLTIVIDVKTDLVAGTIVNDAFIMDLIMNHFSFVIYGGGPIYLRNVQITIWGNTYICSLC